MHPPAALPTLILPHDFRPPLAHVKSGPIPAAPAAPAVPSATIYSKGDAVLRMVRARVRVRDRVKLKS